MFSLRDSHEVKFNFEPSKILILHLRKVRRATDLVRRTSQLFPFRVGDKVGGKVGIKVGDKKVHKIKMTCFVSRNFIEFQILEYST